MTASKQNWIGIELQDTSYSGSAHLVYNSLMAIIDDETSFKQGVRSGIANYMRVGETADNGKTLVQYIHYAKVTDDHVDEAEIVGDMQLSEPDLRNLTALLQDRINKIDGKNN